MDEELIHLLIKGVAAGAKSWVSAQVSKFIPGIGDWGVLVVGAILYWKGGDYHWALKDVGEGLIIASIAQLASRYISGPIVRPVTTTTTASTPSGAEALAVSYASS